MNSPPSVRAAGGGDIEGALGRIRVGERDDQRRSVRRRLLTFLAIMGPGIIVMVGDNDAGGVSTYAQAGQDYTYSLLWVLLLAAAGIALWTSRKRRGRAAAPPPRTPRDQRNQWRMPPLALLKPVTWSLALKLAMLTLRGYLVIAALLLLIKAIQLGAG